MVCCFTLVGGRVLFVDPCLLLVACCVLIAVCCVLFGVLVLVLGVDRRSSFFFV